VLASATFTRDDDALRPDPFTAANYSLPSTRRVVAFAGLIGCVVVPVVHWV